ncbi:hypothetical protein HDK90DRAFT_287108 [Phyllosticta capitalensis]|uniref:Ubiquitin-like domain-containing protein n=1 Tax=Phyllosticta capitalensis TaxID=121624 RepID=A0ABR1YNC9_9PEZI
MADQPIDVRVLSPIPEAEGGINFPSLPPSITIRELKLKIRDALPSHPAPERMRIIYFGRVVGNDMTLGSVFHEETLQTNGRRGNLHMVLSEAPRSSTAPPHAAHSLPRPTPSDLAPAVHASQRPQSQPPRADRVPPPDIREQAQHINDQAHRNALAQAQLSRQQLDQQLAMAENPIFGRPTPLFPPMGPNRVPTQDMNDLAHRHRRPDDSEVLRQQRAILQVFQAGGPTFPPFPPTGPMAPNQTPVVTGTGPPGSAGLLGFPPQMNQIPAGRPNVPQPSTQPQGYPVTANHTGQEAQGPNRQRAHGEHAGDYGSRVRRYAVEASFAAIPAHAAGLPPTPTALPQGIPTGLPPGFPTNVPVQRSVVFAIPPGNVLPNPTPEPRLSTRFTTQEIQQLPPNTLLQQIQDSISNCEDVVEFICNHCFRGTTREDFALRNADNFLRAARQLERLQANLTFINDAIHAMVATPEGSRSREILSLQMENERMRNTTIRLIQGISRHISARRRETQQEAAFEHAQVHQSAGSRIPAPNFGASASAPQSRAGPFVGVQNSARQNGYQIVGPDGTRSLLVPPEPHIDRISPEELAENWAYQRAWRDLVQDFQGFSQNQNQAIDAAALVQQNPAAAALAQVPQAEGQGPLGNIDGIRALFREPVQPGQPAQPQQAPVQNQPQAQGPAGEAANAAIPLGAIAAHFWLLLRIFGMLWLFSGSGWRRTLLMAFCGLVVYIFQSGIFGAVLGERIEGLRRHFEALVGVPPQAGAQAGNAQNANNDQQDGNAADATRRRRREPSPEEVAQRILREREAQRRTWFRDTIQGAERLVALFVASLWPGLGERMVAAREEAEAQARRDAQDREERHQRELQEQQQSQNQASQPTGAESQTQEAPPQAVDATPAVERGNETPVDRSGEDEQAPKVDKGKGRAVETDSAEATVATGSSESSSAAGTTTRRQPWSSNAEE